MHSLKRKLKIVLHYENFLETISGLSSYPDKLVIKGLLSFLCRGDDVLKWRSVTAIGAITSRIYQNSLEDARIVMRQLIWNLSDESGGIGWECPEAMGEIMAQNEILANEFGSILISYLEDGPNFMEFEQLQQGALWGVARLAQKRPDLFKDGSSFLDPYVFSEDPVTRALALRVLSFIDNKKLSALPQDIYGDDREVIMYIDEQMITFPVGRLCEGYVGVPQI